MYFVPILLAAIAYASYPSIILAGLVLIGSATYLRFAGEKVTGQTVALLRGQIAYRLLSVKFIGMNGAADEDTYEVHAMSTPDEPENSELRGLLRDAAATTGAGWQDQARIVRRVYGGDVAQILDRYEMLIVQLNASPDGVTAESQERLVELGKMWRIGPQKAHAFLAENNIQPASAMLAWQ
jgi:hypothetical protein